MCETLISAGAILTFSCRYIDQCEELLNAQTLRTERKDLGVYQTAIDTSNGVGLDWCREEVVESYMTYVGKRYVHEAATARELLPVTYNYEKWISGYT